MNCGTLQLFNRLCLAAGQDFCYDPAYADLPGDCRERLQEALLQNRAAFGLAGIPPEQLLKGYESSPWAKRVDSWLADPIQSHRVELLIRSLTHHLENVADLPRLRNSLGDRIGLGYLLTQLGPQRAQPLQEICQRCGLEPVQSNRRKKPR